MLADEILDGTAKPAPQGVDLRIWFDARRWYLSKLAPKRYGDKLTQELTGGNGAPLIPPKVEVVFVPTPTVADALKQIEAEPLPALTEPAPMPSEWAAPMPTPAPKPASLLAPSVVMERPVERRPPPTIRGVWH